MPIDKAKTFIPQGARPPINPHHNIGSGALDHSVWMDAPADAFTRSHLGSGTGSSPAPLTRARSAQEILASPPQKRYYYEDYADSSPGGSSTSTSSRALHLAPPGPAAASSSYRSPTTSPTQYNYTNTYTSGAQVSEEPTDDSAHMRWSFPAPEVPSYGSGASSSPTFGQPPPSSFGSNNRNGGSRLVLPRKPSHRSTLSQERGEFALPYNNSETSFDAAGVLADVSAGFGLALLTVLCRGL